MVIHQIIKYGLDELPGEVQLVHGEPGVQKALARRLRI
jgi:hypothetical protein